MPYKVFIKNKFTGAVEDFDDEVYETKSDAEDAIPEIENDWLTGIDVLDEAGEATSDPDHFEFIVKRV